MRAARLVVVAVVLITLTAACGSDDKSATSTSSTTVASSSTSTPSTTNTTAAGSTSPVSVAPTHPTAHLVAARAARQEAVDRVVLEFTEQVPGYKVAYQPKPLVGTSGKEVTLAGSAALVVRMEAASAFNIDAGKATYEGPRSLKPGGTHAVKEVAQVEDFEGVLLWAIGVEGERPFKVSTLASPPRLVIDVPS